MMSEDLTLSLQKALHALTPLERRHLERRENDTVHNQTDAQHSNRQVHQKLNYSDRANKTSTNTQLVRGNYTAKADSMGAGQIEDSQKSLLWDKTDTMLTADKSNTG